MEYDGARFRRRRCSGRTGIAGGLAERADPDALVVGPTGVALAINGQLYVADTVNGRIAAISKALFRMDDADAGA